MDAVFKFTCVEALQKGMIYSPKQESVLHSK